MRIGESLALILRNRLRRAVNRDGNAALVGAILHMNGPGFSAHGSGQVLIFQNLYDSIITCSIDSILEGGVPVTIHLRHSCGLRRDSKRTESMGVREGGGHLSARFAYLCLILIAFVLNINILRLINKPLRQRNRNCRLSVNR